MDPHIKRTIVELQAQGVPKDAIASRISSALKNKGRIHNIIDGVVQEASRNNPKKLREEAMAAKRREVERQNLLKKQEKKNKDMKRKMREL